MCKTDFFEWLRTLQRVFIFSDVHTVSISPNKRHVLNFHVGLIFNGNKQLSVRLNLEYFKTFFLFYRVTRKSVLR